MWELLNRMNRQRNKKGDTMTDTLGAIKSADLRENLRRKERRKKLKVKRDDLDHEKRVRNQKALPRREDREKCQNLKKELKNQFNKIGQDLLDINMLLGLQSLLDEKCMKQNLKNTKRTKKIETLLRTHFKNLWLILIDILEGQTLTVLKQKLLNGLLMMKE